MKDNKTEKQKKREIMDVRRNIEVDEKSGLIELRGNRDRKNRSGI